MNNEILHRLEKVEEQLKILIQKIDNLNTSCSRMDNHIDFVEKTYDVLRSPLNLLTNMTATFYGQVEDDNNLPELGN